MASVFVSFAPSGSGQTPGALAAISGTVTADNGVVRAVRVKANDTGAQDHVHVFHEQGPVPDLQSAAGQLPGVRAAGGSRVDDSGGRVERRRNQAGEPGADHQAGYADREDGGLRRAVSAGSGPRPVDEGVRRMPQLRAHSVAQDGRTQRRRVESRRQQDVQHHAAQSGPARRAGCRLRGREGAHHEIFHGQLRREFGAARLQARPASARRRRAVPGDLRPVRAAASREECARAGRCRDGACTMSTRARCRRTSGSSTR